MKGIKLKRVEPVEFPLIMYFLNTLFVGAAITLATVLYMAVSDQKAIILRQEKQLEKLLDTTQVYRDNMEISQKTFHEIESRFTRIEHMMWISRGKRLSAVKEYDE